MKNLLAWLGLILYSIVLILTSATLAWYASELNNSFSVWLTTFSIVTGILGVIVIPNSIWDHPFSDKKK